MARLLRGCGLLAYGLVLLVVFGFAAYTSFSLFVRSGVTTVPSLLGLSPAEAANALADNGLTLRDVQGEGRYDDQVPPGRVARQSPDPRTLVKRDSSVAVVLSLGPQRVKVPDLSRRMLPEAQAALSGTGLALGKILGAYGPAGAVAPATPVDLLLTMGVPAERFVMPDLIYRDYDLVRASFERQGFRFGSVRFEQYEGVVAGVILRQFPLPGHPLSKDDPVSLVVATTDGQPGA
jgi:serine/threonine-protein kinase